MFRKCRFDNLDHKWYFISFNVYTLYLSVNIDEIVSNAIALSDVEFPGTPAVGSAPPAARAV